VSIVLEYLFVCLWTLVPLLNSTSGIFVVVLTECCGRTNCSYVIDISVKFVIVRKCLPKLQMTNQSLKQIGLPTVKGGFISEKQYTKGEILTICTFSGQNAISANTLATATIGCWSSTGIPTCKRVQPGALESPKWPS
jgi:hypothetical protein